MLRCGKGTNKKGELMDLLCLHYFSQLKCISNLQIVGYSKIIIDWLSKKCKLQVVVLEAWKQKVEELVLQFSFLDNQHIYREHTTEDNDLSK